MSKNKTILVETQYEDFYKANILKLRFKSSFVASEYEEEIQTKSNALEKIKSDLTDIGVFVRSVVITDTKQRKDRNDEFRTYYEAAITFECNKTNNWKVMNYLGGHGFIVCGPAEFYVQLDDNETETLLNKLYESASYRIQWLSSFLKFNVIDITEQKSYGPAIKPRERQYVYASKKIYTQEEDPFYKDLDNPPKISVLVETTAEVLCEITDDTDEFFKEHEFNHPYVFELYKCATRMLKSGVTYYDISTAVSLFACKELFTPSFETEIRMNQQLRELTDYLAKNKFN